MRHWYSYAALALFLTAATVAAQPFDVVPSPNVGAGDNTLGGVDGRAPDDVWAVGSYHHSAQGADQTLAMRWDGVAWTVDPTPNPGPGASSLSDVATPPDGTVWAVGAKGTPARPMVLRRAGGTWSEAALGFGGTGRLTAVHDRASDDIWAVGMTLRTDGFPDDGLAFHYDGASWTQTPLPGVSVMHSLADVDASAPDDVWAVGTARQTIFGNASPLAYRWDGTAWAVVPTPFDVTGLSAVTVFAPDDVWVAGRKSSGRGMMAHWDGSGWTGFDSQGPAPVRAVALAEDGTPFAVTDGTLYRYESSAGQWDEALGTFTGRFFDVATGPGGHVWAGSGGVYGSLDGGQTWDWDAIHTSPHSGTPASIFTVAVGPDETVYAWGWRSTDNGQTWQAMSWGLIATAFVGTTVYAGTIDGVYRSATSGASWTPSGLTGLEVRALASSGARFAAASEDGLWTSADGATWTPAAAFAGVEALAATSDGAFWAAAPDGLYRSDDGVSWPSSPTAFADESVKDVTARGVTLLAVVDGVPYRSTDTGATWTALTEGLSTTGGAPFTASNALVALASSDVYGFGERIVHWDGTAWTEVDALVGFTSPRIEGAVLLPDGTIWATGHVVEGNVRRTLTLRSQRIPVAVAPPERPVGYTLSAVYPNPFNPQARFTLEVAEAQAVTVAVFDALGRRVAVLHDGPLAAGAMRTFTLDGADLPSGLYVVRVTGETFTAGRMATLLK